MVEMRVVVNGFFTYKVETGSDMGCGDYYFFLFFVTERVENISEGSWGDCFYS